MAYSEPDIIDQPQFQVVGLSIVTSLHEAAEQHSVKRLADELNSRREEIADVLGSDTYLVQLYPESERFDEHTRYTVILGVRVDRAQNVPPGMTAHVVPAGRYARVTHHGPESLIGGTYNHVVGSWLPRSGFRHAGHDFERFDERYDPDSVNNQIDLHIALKAVGPAGVIA